MGSLINGVSEKSEKLDIDPHRMQIGSHTTVE